VADRKTYSADRSTHGSSFAAARRRSTGCRFADTLSKREVLIHVARRPTWEDMSRIGDPI